MGRLWVAMLLLGCARERVSSGSEGKPVDSSEAPDQTYAEPAHHGTAPSSPTSPDTGVIEDASVCPPTCSETCEYQKADVTVEDPDVKWSGSLVMESSCVGCHAAGRDDKARRVWDICCMPRWTNSVRDGDLPVVAGGVRADRQITEDEAARLEAFIARELERR